MPIIKVPSPVQILFVDRLLKGDKGDPGTSGTGGESVEEHETLYDHGRLHEHSNKNVLDLLSVISGDVAYNGTTLVDSVTQSQAFQDVEATVAKAATDVASTAANHYLFTTNYAFVAWLARNRPDDHALFSSMWVAAPPDESPG